MKYTKQDYITIALLLALFAFVGLLGTQERHDYAQAQQYNQLTK